MRRHSSRGVSWSPEVLASSSKGGVVYRSSRGPATPTTSTTRPDHHSSNHLPAASPFSKQRSYDSIFSVESSVFSKLSVPKLPPEGSSSSSSKKPAGETWRKHGKLHRAILLVQDEEIVGNAFALSPSCSIEKYYEISSHVLDQFLKTPVDERKDLTESYLVGNRLVRFLSTVLPTHPYYFPNDPMLLEHRNKSQEQLVELMQYLDQLALIIDEYEYNRYILKDLNGKDVSEADATLQLAKRSSPPTCLLNNTKLPPEGSSSSSSKKPAGETWRKHGKLHRAILLVQDEEIVGNAFTLSPSCSIEKYYEISSHVLDQFLKTPVDESKDLTESYLVGNRLVRFLSTVLPTHPYYFSDDPMLLEHRNKSQEQLVELMQYLDQLALIIDEYEYNRYILKDLNGKDASEADATLQQAKRSSPPSLLNNTNSTTQEPPGLFDDGNYEDSIASQEHFLAGIDEEFNEARQMHFKQVHQKYDSSSWDGSYEKSASHHKNPRVRMPKKQEAEQPLPVEKSARNKMRTNRDERQPEGESLDWNPSFPMSFCEKIQEDSSSRNASQASSRSSHVDSMYSPRLMGEQAADKVGGIVTRGQSPKSANEFPDWVRHDDEISLDSCRRNSHAVMGYIELLVDNEERPPPSDAFSVATSEEEELSLTGGSVTKRKQQLSLRKFKGCIKCLLD